MVKKIARLLEIPLFYLFLVLLNQKFNLAAPAFLDVEPHPYWIGILLFGFRYGILSGLLAGVISAALYLGITWFSLEKYLFYDVTFYLLPSMFILGGTLIGMGVNKYKRTIAQLDREKDILIKNEAPLRQEIATLQEINSGLEKKVVSQMSSLMTLYEGARKLESVNLDELYHSILDFISRTLGVEEGSIYLKEDSGWTLKESWGWKVYQKRPTHLKLAEGMIGMAGSSNKIVSLRDFIQEGQIPPSSPQLLGECLAAGPLCLGERGEVVAVYSIQQMPFLKFNSATISLLSFLLQWASRSLERAHYIKNLQAKDILDTRYDVYSCRYFLSRANQEFSRSRLYYLPLSTGLVKIEGDAAWPPAMRHNATLAVATLLKEVCREIDVVASFDPVQAPLAILFITANENQTNEIAQKISATFSQLNLAPPNFPTALKLRIGLASFTPQTQSFEEMITKALQKLESPHES